MWKRQYHSLYSTPLVQRNMNENVHRFAIRGKLLERELERKNEIKRQREREER